jgi:hypothetical protein
MDMELTEKMIKMLLLKRVLTRNTTLNTKQKQNGVMKHSKKKIRTMKNLLMRTMLTQA